MDQVKKTFLLCPDKDGCCPEVIIDGRQVIIKDDFGGKIKLTRDQFDFLKEKIKRDNI